MVTWLWISENTDIFNIGFSLEFLKKLVKPLFDLKKVVFVLGYGEFGLKLLITFIYGFATIFNLLSSLSHRFFYDRELKLILLFGQQFIEFEDISRVSRNSLGIGFLQFFKQQGVGLVVLLKFYGHLEWKLSQGFRKLFFLHFSVQYFHHLVLEV